VRHRRLDEVVWADGGHVRDAEHARDLQGPVAGLEVVGDVLRGLDELGVHGVGAVLAVLARLLAERHEPVVVLDDLLIDGGAGAQLVAEGVAAGVGPDDERPQQGDDDGCDGGGQDPADHAQAEGMAPTASRQ